MRLVIAEKPSVAKAIRAVVGSSYEVTHCVGHMLEQAPPDAYDPRWKSWNVDLLPITVRHWKLQVKPDTADQLKKIGDLLKKAKEVIHAGDPDREGQLLVDEVLEYFGWRGPTRRVLINATDDATIRKAFARIEDNSKYRPLMLSAQCRQRADWLVGMNLSRAVTKLLSDEATISIGRVQTPTLALLVRRHKEIKNFRPETFYTLAAQFSLQGGRTLTMKHEPDPRILVEKDAKALAAAVRGQSVPLSVAVKPGVRHAPLPFDLPAFQRAAESYFGWGAAKSLQHLQEAYESKLTTYPRTDCRYLPADQAGDALRIARAVAPIVNCPDKLLSLMAPSPRIYDSSKVAEHHGLIPTGVVPSEQTPRAIWQAWALVSLQFLASLLPDEKYEETVVRALVPAPQRQDPLLFSARGETPRNPGASWADLDMDALFSRQRQTKQAPSLPPLRDGERAVVEKCEVVAGKTTPPKPYTEASLIADMRSVAKFVDDPVLKAKLKETSGIGTAATQAGIIETLKARGFAMTIKKNLEPTELGVQVIEAIPPKLADPGVTAAWEDALSKIAAGQYDPEQFMRRVEMMVSARLAEVRECRMKGARITAKSLARPSAPARNRSGAHRPNLAPSGPKGSVHRSRARKAPR